MNKALRNMLSMFVFLSLAASAVQVPLAADEPTVEQAQAQWIPWSGYWWPLYAGGLLGPLKKYDQITGRQAAQWEQTHHPIMQEVQPWHGYCHAWAASAVMEPEPTASRLLPGLGAASVLLGIGDQKGLLAACHTEDLAHIYGRRTGQEEQDNDSPDLTPDRLWQLLRLYLRDQGAPLILDIEAGPEVWNFPVFAYELRYRPQEDRPTVHLTLLMADNSVPPDYQGVKLRKHTYTFTVRLRQGAVVLGSGQWTGLSRNDHPDFAWYPFLPKAENPEIDYQKVQQLLGFGWAQPPSSEPGEVSPSEAESSGSKPPAEAPEPKPQPSAGEVSQPTPKPQPTPTEPVSEPTPKPQPKPGPSSPSAEQPQPMPQPKTEPTPQPKPQPTPQPKPEPTTASKPEPAAKPPTEPLPGSKPQPMPKPPAELPSAEQPQPMPKSKTEPPASKPQPGSSPPGSGVAGSVLPSGFVRPAPPAGPSAVVLSPEELVALVAQKTSSFGLDITLDRFDGATYRWGETFSIRGASGQAGYLYLLHLDSQGQLTLLYPLPGQDNRIPAQTPFQIPGPGDRFAFRALPPAGLNRIKAIVTSRPLHLTGLQAQVSLAQEGAQTPPSQTKPGASPPDWPRQTFRWHPSQRRQLQQMLTHYHQHRTLPEPLAEIDPRRLLGPFAQDEVTFYVEAPAGESEKPNVSPSPTSPPCQPNLPKQPQKQNGAFASSDPAVCLDQRMED